MDTVCFDTVLLSAAEQLSEKMREHNICLYLTGLAASGKSAVALIVSRITGVPVVDSGLPFRLATYLCWHFPVAGTDMNLFDKLLNAHSIKVIGGEYRIFSGSSDITDRLRAPEIDRDVPRVAGDVKLREIVLRFLRSTTTAPAIIAARGATEPLASGHILQIELTTDFNVRVERRMKQGGLPFATVKKSIRDRDIRDLRGPSRYPSPDYLDTTHLTLYETTARVIAKASERIDRLYSFNAFRRKPFPDENLIYNPLLNKAWEYSAGYVEEFETKMNVPFGQTKGRFMLHLSRFSVRELFLTDTTDGCIWHPGVFPTDVPVDLLKPREDLLKREAERMVTERRVALDAFFAKTLLPDKIIEPVVPSFLHRSGSKLIAKDESGKQVERYEIKDASKELGIAVESHLHYLGIPRADCTHRIVLVETSTELPVLYISFAPNSRKYFEPLLWAFGLRMEEVAVAARGYGWPRCPKNAMGLFLRMASKRVADDFPHLKAIITDINPNWGFSGNSFKEAGFISIGLKHAPTCFVGDEYTSRRGIEGQKGNKAAIPNKLSLVPTLIMLKPFNDGLVRSVTEASNKNGLYLIPRTLYEDK